MSDSASAAPGWQGGFAAEPDGEGWFVRPASAGGEFVDLYGAMKARPEGDGRARLRIDTHGGFANFTGSIHGGFLLAFVDQALFVGPTVSGVRILGGVTVDLTSQFLARGEVGKPLDAVTEILRETGRMLFVRGQLEQDGVAVLAFTGTLRKPS